MNNPRILAFDLETAPNLVYTFQTFKAYIRPEQIVEPARVIAFSAQWYGQKTVIFKSEYHDGREEMLQAMWALLDAADVLVTYNGKRFDRPWIEGEFLVEGLGRPSPSHHIDLYQVIRSNSRFPSNKLDYTAYRLLNDRKVEHPGFSMWWDCLRGSEEEQKKAWNLMRKYAKKDTALLAPLFDELSPWIKMPYSATNDNDTCPMAGCGSKHLTKRGYRHTTARRYQRFVCDQGHWSSSPLGEAVGGNLRSM